MDQSKLHTSCRISAKDPVSGIRLDLLLSCHSPLRASLHGFKCLFSLRNQVVYYFWIQELQIRFVHNDTTSAIYAFIDESQTVMLKFGSAFFAVAALTTTLGLVTTTFAFVPIPVPPPARTATTDHGSVSSTSTTRLYISSWGISSGPAGSRSLAEPKDIVKRMQDYLPEPQAVEARTNVDATITVSGAANARELRTDQFLFDLLNHQDSAFEFTKIVAAVRDPALAKKRLLSRSARYTGLLDKLDFVATPAETGLPTAEQLSGSKSWLAVVDVVTEDSSMDWKAQCLEIVTTASAVDGLENVAVLLTGANELAASDCQAIVDSFKATNKTYTIVAVGQLEDHPEGQQMYHFGQFGDAEAVLPAQAVFSRQEAYRMVTELLQLECGVNQALTFAEVYNVNVTEVKLIKGLREAGYARPQEIDHMVREGPKVSLASRVRDLL